MAKGKEVRHVYLKTRRLAATQPLEQMYQEGGEGALYLVNNIYYQVYHDCTLMCDAQL